MSEWGTDCSKKEFERDLRKAIPFTLGLLLSNCKRQTGAPLDVARPATYLGEHLHLGQVYSTLSLAEVRSFRESSRSAQQFRVGILARWMGRVRRSRMIELERTYEVCIA